MTSTFTNPIITGFNPDPSIARVGKEFFLTTSTFEYFPGLPIYHSTNLLDWKLIGHALTRRSQLDMRTVEPGAGIWAPTLRWRKDGDGEQGRFYLATCKWDRYRPNNDERIFPRGFYIYTDNIWDERAWSEPVYFDNPGFDQDLFWDDDGKVYLSTTTRIANRPPNSKLKDFAIHISEIDLPTGKTLTAPIIIRASPYGIAEGSHIMKRSNYYYLFTAEGGTESGHQEWVLRSSKGPFGPWELGPRNPLWYNGPEEAVQNTGHVDVFDDADGHWWAVLLGVRPRNVGGRWKDSVLGRETFLVKVDWIDDWPVFNDGHTVSILGRSHGSTGTELSGDVRGLQWKADLSNDVLESGWYQKNTPLKQSYSLTSRPGHIRLHGNCYDLSSPEAPALLLRKQTALQQTFRTILDFRPTMEGYEAGIVVWWSLYTYASIGIMLKGGDRTLVIRVPDMAGETGSFQKEERKRSVSKHEPLELSIESGEKGYILGFIGTEFSHFVSADSLVSSPPIGGAFTGMMFGIYAFGRGDPCLDPADFSAISIKTRSL